MSEISPQSFSRPKYRADIDGMRALAILAVLIFHAYPSSLPGGFVGVDIFFVISGYLISSIIFKGLTLGTFSFFDFYARRVRRIFPAVTVVILGSLLLGLFFVTPFVLDDMIKEAPSAAFFIENFRLLRLHGAYWDLETTLKPFMHFWSLAVEEQYYIIYPLLCFYLWKTQAKTFLTILLVLLMLSFGLCLYETEQNAIRAFYMLHTRFWELLIGGILAYIELKKPCLLPHIFSLNKSIIFSNHLISALGLVLIVIAIVFFHEWEGFPGWRALLPVVGTVLIIMAGNDAYLNKIVLSNKIVVFVGLISYPLYLWHWPLISIVKNNLGGELPGGLLMIAILVLSFILAYLTYSFVERPLRSRKITVKLIIVLISTLFVVTVGLKSVVRHEDLLKTWLLSKAPSDVMENSLLPSEDDSYDFNCTSRFGSDVSMCRTFGSFPRTIIFGDSHALLLWNVLKDKVPSEGLYLIASHGGFIFENARLSKVRREDVQPAMKEIWNRLGNAPDIGTIVLMGYWSSYLTRDIEVSNTNYISKDEMFRQEWRLVFEKLDSLNKDVIVVLDNPVIPERNLRCLSSRAQQINLFSDSRCSFELQDLSDEEVKSRTMLIEEAQNWKNVKIFDLQMHLCPQGNCPIIDDGKRIYRDSNHLSPEGYGHIWPRLEYVINSFKYFH